jgi:anti-anti-sigma factor
VNGPAFSVWAAEEDGRTVLWAAGELDLTAVPAMDGALSAVPVEPGRRLIVDLSRLVFLDAAGARLLAADDRRRGVGGGGLAVRGTRAIVRRTLELMQLTWLLDQAEPAPRGMPQQVARLGLARQRALAVQAVNERLLDLGRTDRLISFSPD